jgi:hypothetical protein
MPNNEIEVDDRRVGDDWPFAFSVTDVTPTDALASAIFVLKSDGDALDAAGEVALTITTALQAHGEITATGGTGDGDGTATVLVKVADTVTETLVAYTPYALALKTVSVAGVEITSHAGTLTPLPRRVSGP